ncbi:alpha/beta hydrolase [Streptomyces sp. NBC_01190]|uniref:alpha/beta hydrolase n=1 Tax=Streptomyces sp. NBC_01190 TaxID=2903767 RepID=UPI00386BA687|nr:alpha/beta hydrolase [Streptomyces sp. NBC_01190]
MSEPSAAPPIMLIHGLWMSPHSWRPWIDRFTAAGHVVHAPAWPGVSELDQELHHDRAPADIGVTELVDHYHACIQGLGRQPIIVGHSFGGLVTEMLLDRGLGRAAVALHPAPPRGVRRRPVAALRSAFPVLGNPANLRRAVTLDEDQFRYAFANAVPAAQAAEERARLAVPGPGRPVFQVALANLTRGRRAATVVDFANRDRVPLLLVSGGADHVVPAEVVRENFTRFGGSTAVTAYRTYPYRDHGTVFHQGWEEVADHALSWAMEHQVPAPAPRPPKTADATDAAATTDTADRADGSGG